MKHTSAPIKIIPAVLFILLFLSCSGKNKPAETSAENAEGMAPWYYFSENGLRPVQNPAAIPFGGFLPWTEAVRVTDCGFSDSQPVLLVNRIGLILPGESGKPEVLAGGKWFAGRTAGSAYQSSEGLSARLYRNSFFSENGQNPPGREPFFALFDKATKTIQAQFYPSDLGLDDTAQCVALDRIGSMWYASFKQEKSQRIDFSYLEFESFPVKNPEGGLLAATRLRRISADAYRASVKPFPISQASQSVRDILSALSPDTALQLRFYTPEAPAVQIFTREGTEPALTGTILQFAGKTALLFSDGTFYYSEEGREGIRALTLPKLSRGYIYGPFIIDGQRLLASWEEQRFFETGRAGLLEVDLAGVL